MRGEGSVTAQFSCSVETKGASWHAGMLRRDQMTILPRAMLEVFHPSDGFPIQITKLADRSEEFSHDPSLHNS